MSNYFKIESDDGGATIGSRIDAKNGSYWSVTFHRPSKVPDTVCMTDVEVGKLLRKYGFDAHFIKRILGA